MARCTARFFYYSRCFHRRLSFGLAALIFLASLSGLGITARAAERFGDHWQARPLIDHTAQTGADMLPASPASNFSVEGEVRLAPYEPFIREVESALSLAPSPGTSRVARLNAIQNILFAGQAYRGDAGELIARLQTLFPQQAARAAALAKQSEGASFSDSGVPALPQQNAGQIGQLAGKKAEKRASRTTGRRKDDFSDVSLSGDAFSDDAFFRDDNAASPSIANRKSSRFKEIGEGLAGVAMVAGGLAANAYLGRKMFGRSTTGPAYGYGPYNYGYAPYGGVPPYGAYGYLGLPYALSGRYMPGYANGYSGYAYPPAYAFY